MSVLEWHYPTQVKSKRLCKSHGIKTAKCCITSEHIIQHIFILLISLWGRKVSSSYCCGSFKRDALFIPTLQKIYGRGKYFISAVLATILHVTSSMISDVQIWKFGTNHMTIHTNSSGLVVIHLFVCFSTRIFWTAGFTVLFSTENTVFPKSLKFFCLCMQVRSQSYQKAAFGGLVVVWIYFLLFWFKHIIQHNNKTSQISNTKILHSATLRILVFDLYLAHTIQIKTFTKLWYYLWSVSNFKIICKFY